MASLLVFAPTVSAILSGMQHRHFFPKADNSSTTTPQPTQPAPSLVYPFYNVDIIDSVFEDISGDSILAQVSNVDDPTPARPDDMVRLPFEFTYFEKPVTNIFIDPNGFISTLSQICYSPIGFCNWGFTTPRYTQFMGPLMSDWGPQLKAESLITYRIDSTSAVQRLIVQYSNVSLSSNIVFDENFSFQVIVSSDGSIQFNYQNVPYDPATKSFTFDLGDGSNITLPYPSFIGLQGSILGRTATNRLVLVAPYPFVSVPFTQIQTGNTLRSVKFTPRPSCSQWRTCSDCAAHANGSAVDLPCGWCQATMQCVNLPSNLDPTASTALCPNAAQFGTTDAQCLQFNVSACNATDGWPLTQPGANSSRSCPDGFTGFETRTCSNYGIWGNVTKNCKEIPGDAATGGAVKNGVRISKGGIAGIVVGCVVGVAILIVLAACLYRKRSELYYAQLDAGKA